MRTIRKLKLAALGLAAVVAVAACGNGGQGQSQPKGPNQLRIGIGVIPVSMDPGFDTGSWAIFVYNQVYDTLVNVDSKGNIQPGVATSWKTVSPTQWELKLRTGVKFQNGENLDAAAAMASIQRILDPANKSPWANRIALIDHMTAPDPQTLEIYTKSPFGTLLQGLLTVWMVPPQYFKDKGLAGFAAAPVGSGPFKLTEYVKSDHVLLSAWKDGWRGAPKVDSVLIRNLPEDATRVSALQAGEVDVAWAVPAENAADLKRKGDTIIAQPIAQSMVINLQTTGGGPMADQQVRQALNYAIDKEALNKSILGGYGRVLDGQLVGPDGFGYDPSLKAYPYDKAKAKQMLAAAGYPNGFDVTFNGTVGRYPKDKEIQEAIVSQLADVGVRAKLNILEQNAFLAGFFAGKDGPMFTFGWQYLPSMDADQPMTFFQCSASIKLFCDKSYDAVYQKQQADLDAATRKADLQKASAVLHDLAPVLYLTQFDSIFGVGPRVHGFKPGANYSADLAQVSLS
mgnify:CR=1 FL=1